MMNEFLLNDEVSLYDWSQGKSDCIIAKDYTPCCTTNQTVWWSWFKYINYRQPLEGQLPQTMCRKSEAYKEFFVTKDDGTETNLCFYYKHYIDQAMTQEVECPVDMRTACIYDKNGVGCCTDNMELLHSWHDSGCVGGKCSIVAIANEFPDFLTPGFFRPAVDPTIMYALQNTRIKDRYNFECPTHHPVPAVAIILGLFIPTVVILLGIIGIIRYRNTPIKKEDEEEGESDEEEAAVDEIPPAE